MANENKTIFQKLTKVFGYSGKIRPENTPTFNFSKNELLKTNSKEEYEKELLQAQQSKYIGDKWAKLDQSLYNQSVYYEPNRLSAYYDYEAMEYCLAGETKIATQEGFVTIKELADKGRDYEFITYSYDHNNKTIVPAIARNAHYTRDEETYKITFDDNSYIIGTWEHRLMRRDGSFVKICDLQIGESMMPFYRKTISNNDCIYSCNQFNEWLPEITMKLNKNKTDVVDESIKIPFDLIVDATLKYKTLKKTSKKLKVSDNILLNKINSSGYDKWPTFFNAYNKPTTFNKYFLNHKVVSIEANGVIPVYDLTVPGYKNFATDTIFSHNTPEISAALDIFSEESCLVGDTLITLLNNKQKTIKELYDEKYYDFWVYGFKIDENLIKPSKVKSVISKGLKDVYRITLSDGTEIQSTDNHKWLLDDNTWIETKDLRFDMQLKSITQKTVYGEQDSWSNDDNTNVHKVISVEYSGSQEVFDLLNSSVDSSFGVSCNNGMIISHNCTVSEKGKILTIFSESNRVKNILEDLFENVLDINTNLQMWTRGVCKYGDDFIYLKIDPQKGIIGCQQLPNIEIERIEGASSKNDGQNRPTNLNSRELRFHWKNKDLEFQSWEIGHFRLLGDDRKLPYGTCLKYDSRIQIENGVKEIKDIVKGDNVWSFDTKTQTRQLSKVLDTVNSGVKTTFKISTKSSFIEASKEHKILCFIENEFIYKNVLDLSVGDLLIINENILEPIISIEKSGEFETYDIYVENENHNFYCNDIVVHNSMLDKIRRIWKQLLLAEDAMLIYRTSRAPERRVFKIFVGNMDDKDVESYVQRTANKFKRDNISDPRNGQVDTRYNQMSVDQDYFIPVRDMSQASPIETLPGACLSLDTRIPLLDGRTLSLNEIINEWDNGVRDQWVYSCNPNDGESAPGLITWAGITRKNTNVMKITLDNGKEIITTPDHKFVHRTNGFVEAQNLNVGDSLMPFYTNEDYVVDKKDYQIWDTKTQKWIHSHKMFSDFFNDTKSQITSLNDDNSTYVINEETTESFYNHLIIKIEHLEHKIDTGTITVDGNEIYHNYHTFAIESGVYVKNSNLGEISDIEYIQKKLLAALRIPKAFLGFEEVVGDGKTLALMDIRFARTINRIQKSMIQELNKIALVHLYLLGLEDELDNFTLSLTNPSAQSDLLKIEQWKEKITLYKDATSDQSQIGILPVSHSWAKKNILGMSDNEVLLDLQQQRLERGIGNELINTSFIIKRSGIFDVVDAKYGIPEEEREKMETNATAQAQAEAGAAMPSAPSGEQNEIPLSENIEIKKQKNKTKKEKIFNMLGENEKNEDLFNYNKALNNIYDIENKIDNIIND